MVQSLRFRLNLLLLLVAVPGIAFIVYQGFAERENLRRWNDDRSERIMSLLVAEYQRAIAGTRAYLSALSAAAEVQTPSAEACRDFLSTALALNGLYQSLVVTRADGSLRCATVRTEQAPNLSDQSFVQAALDKRVFSIGRYTSGPLVHDPAIGFATPIYGDGDTMGEMIGVAVAAITLERWNTELRGPLPTDVVAYFTDAGDRVIAARPTDFDLLDHPVSEIGVPKRMPTAGNQVLVQGPDGVRRVFSMRKVDAGDAGVAGQIYVGLSVEEALFDLRRWALVRFLVLSSVLAAAWLLASRLLASEIARPLDALSDTIDALEAGESQPTPDGRQPNSKSLSTIPELGGLSRQVHRMAGARWAAEQAETRQREEMTALLEALPDLYFRIAGDGTILDWRGRDESDLLVTPDRFLGRTMSEFLPPDVLRLFERNMQRHRTSGTVVAWEYELQIAGERRSYEARACPVAGREETVLVVRNITERKRTEEFLRTAAMVYETSSEGMIVTDAAGRIETVNPAIARETGYTRDQLIGRTVADLIDAADQSGILARAAEGDIRSDGSFWTGELLLRRASGEAYPAWVTLNEIRSDSGAVLRRVILSRDMTELKKANEEIRRQAELDVLTGLPNRRFLTSGLAEACARAKQKGEPLALLFIDVDRLKQVNDRLGHAAGDAVLVQVAQRLRGCIEQSDLVARQAGDEFIVLMSGPDAEARSRAVADRILAEIARPFPVGGETARLSASMGIALYPHDADDPDLLLAAADQAMFEAKTDGRDRARRFSPQIRQNASDRIRLLDELHRGLDGGQFELHYQPIVELSTGRVAKAEALMRWQHPDLGPISPVRFIPLAEAARLIRPLGDWTLKRASADLPKLRACFGDDFQISLNMSPVQLTADPGPEDLDWAGFIAASECDRGAFVVEVTEGALLDPDPEVARRLTDLRAAGAMVALDDFGTGYSSLLYFLRHDFDFLKIDREFVQGLSDCGKSAVLCESMLHMAHRLGCLAIAEGIETPRQCAALRQAGCDFGQGYHFSAPLPLDDLTRLPRILDRS